jgi:hypothetical protein
MMPIKHTHLHLSKVFLDPILVRPSCLEWAASCGVRLKTFFGKSGIAVIWPRCSLPCKVRSTQKRSLVPAQGTLLFHGCWHAGRRLTSQ